MFDKKKVVLYEPDELQRMLIEIWLTRTPFEVLRNVPDNTQFENSLTSNLYEIGICCADLPEDDMVSLVGTATKSNIPLVFIANKTTRILYELQQHYSSIIVLHTPFQQKDLLHALISLTGIGLQFTKA